VLRLSSVAHSQSPRARHAAATAIVAALALLWPTAAQAQSHGGEAAARALQKKAMEDDFLNTDFDKAADKMGQALAKCGTDKCGVQLRAQLKRDLSAVLSAAGKHDPALAAMIDALKIDASIKLDPNFKTKDLEAVYAEAKKGATSAPASGSSSGPPVGDFTHIAVTEQQVRTPIPIYVEYSGTETIKRVMAKYKGMGMTEWKSAELKPIGKGFGGTAPCADVQSGDFVYYLQGFNEQNDPVAAGGDRANPYKVNVKNESVSDPPHLPGQSPPTQCADTGDCPPDFPGCKKTPSPVEDPSLKGKGETCEDDAECKSGSCKDTKCTAPKEDSSSSSSNPGRKKWWVGVGGSVDFSFLSSANNVCQLYLPGQSATYSTIPFSSSLQGTPTNSQGYYCTQGGADFPARTLTGVTTAGNLTPTTGIGSLPNKPDSVGGGAVPGDVRIFATIDYAATASMMLGLRLGYVTGTYPGSQASHFAPIHAEARYSYVFGDEPIGKAGLHPQLFVGAGLGEYDANVNVAVAEMMQAGMSCAQKPLNGICTQTVAAWRTGGPFFIAGGGGARWELVPGVAAMLNLKLVGAIGSSAGFAFVPTPEAAVQFGF
jgi:hypothetical protein